MMNSQGQLRVTHYLGQLVGVAHYGTVHHPLQGYSSPLTAMGSPQEADSLALAATTTTTTLAHCLPHTQSHIQQSGTTLACGVTFAHQAPHPEIQYCCNSAEPTLPHPQGRHSSSTTTQNLQPANITPLVPQPIPTQLAGAEETRVDTREKQGRRVPVTSGNSVRLCRKRCRNSGRAYISTAGKAVPSKKYVEQNCDCRHECLAKLGTTAEREDAFRRFWDIGDFEKQNVHLAQSVVLMPSSSASSRERHPDPPQNERHLRTVRRMYYVKLKEGHTRVRVCKSQFLRLHGVSNGRLDRVLQAFHCARSNGLQDRRGQHTPSNKTASEDVELVAQHILEVQQQGVRVLEGTDTPGKGMSVKRMHEMYQKWCEAQGRTPVSLWVYRQVWRGSLTPQEGKEDYEATVGGGTQVDGEEEKKEEEEEEKEEQGAIGIVTGGHLDIHEGVLGLSSSSTTTTTTITVTSNPSATSITNKFPFTTTTLANATMTATCNDISPTLTIHWSASPTTTTGLCTTTTSISATTTTTTTIALDAVKQRRSRSWRRRLKEADLESGSMSRAERKARRNKGEAYITSSGKLCSRKVYLDSPCGCRHQCIPALGTPQTRLQVFDNFWGLASFTKQNAYIARMVTLAPLGRCRASATPSRIHSRVYSVQLKDGGDMVRVCKVAFLCLHGISNGRLDRVMQAVAGQSPYALKDLRGCHAPKNKTQEEDARHALSHICTFTLGNSGQHSRHCQLLQNLTIEKMYRLYCEECVSEGRRPVGSFVYRKILKKRLQSSLEEVQ